MGFNKKNSLHTFFECDNENTKAISPVTAMSFPKTQIPSVLTEEKTAIESVNQMIPSSSISFGDSCVKRPYAGC